VGPYSGADVVSVALSQTPALAARPQIRDEWIVWCACLCPRLRQCQFILRGDRGTWVWTTCQDCYSIAQQSGLMTTESPIRSPTTRLLIFQSGKTEDKNSTLLKEPKLPILHSQPAKPNYLKSSY